MKRTCLVITVCLGLSGVGAGTYSGGLGTAESPYKISRVADWQELMATSGDWSKTFLLTADLDFAGAAITPVGNYDTPFTGVLNGGGHTLSNLKINQPGGYDVGPFGYIGFSGQIRNLGVVNTP
jgi:large repetitive protein